MIESLLAEAAETGWLINNLYQLDTGEWRCNFRRDDFFTDFATEATCAGALSAALDLLDTATYHKPPPMEGSIDYSPTALEGFRQRMVVKIPTFERRD